MKNLPKILITPGEPSGIGYDILLSIAKKKISRANNCYYKPRALKRKSQTIK